MPVAIATAQSYQYRKSKDYTLIFYNGYLLIGGAVLPDVPKRLSELFMSNSLGLIPLAPIHMTRSAAGVFVPLRASVRRTQSP